MNARVSVFFFFSLADAIGTQEPLGLPYVGDYSHPRPLLFTPIFSFTRRVLGCC
jgi:hypothetical protein